ncbi:MAG: FG-GAP-like repeat-containing protein [Planctomycetota bacterium]|nr:FG-GAP-like repeat-containing protein [Planctomycetota bacterium]
MSIFSRLLDRCQIVADRPQFGRRQQSGRKRGKLRPRRLRLEPLEERRLLAYAGNATTATNDANGTVDNQPPTVMVASSSFSGGSLDAGTTSLTIEFSEAVLGGDTADNYQLKNLGPDALLGTADDLLLPLSVNYAGATATLSFPALPESVYRLTVRDAITDAVGNSLDGDTDGAPGGNAQEEFVAVPPRQSRFVSGATYPTGTDTSLVALVAADFSGDGIVDLVTVNSDCDSITLSFGDGIGGFITVGTFPTGGSSPKSVTVGDFNGDGKKDLAVANAISQSVGVLLGNGIGGFTAAVTYASGGSYPNSVTVGDFNNDGNSDLAVVNTNSDSVGVLLGNGAGGFAVAVTYVSGGFWPSSVTVGDFNGDGNSDLAIANSDSDNVGVLLGNGAGGFAAAVTYASGGMHPNSIAVDDFNGDGNSDLAVANMDSGNVGILLGYGPGGFAAADLDLFQPQHRRPVRKLHRRICRSPDLRLRRLVSQLGQRG